MEANFYLHTVRQQFQKLHVLSAKHMGSLIAMGSKNLGTDLNIAWPTAEIAVLGPEAAITIIHRKSLKDSSDAAGKKKSFAKEYRNNFANPYIAAEREAQLTL